MKKTILWVTTLLAGAALLIQAQPSIRIVISGGDKKPRLAVPDLRGSGDAARFMDAFNQTLFADLQDSGMFDMVAKSMYPLLTPQRPEDFRPPPQPDNRPQNQKGNALADWSAPPVSSSHLAFGYTGAQGDQLLLLGWLYDVSQANPQQAQLLGKRYFAAMSEDGARRLAHEFAADIIAALGGQSLLGTRIYFVSDRTRNKEIWSMDPDGANQKPFTSYRSLSLTPSVSPDGTRIAFMTYARGNPAIFVHSLETGRRLPFFNQQASMNETPNFTPDGQEILYSSTVSGYVQIYRAKADGGNPRRLSSSRAVEVEAKVNPKGGTVAFVSGRSGPPQIYMMTLDGSSPERLTAGEGDAVNPAWHPNGQYLAFAWSRGYEPGNFNIFIMDVASRQFEQLTHGAGRNENPVWAPDGRHLVFCSTRSGSSQIWTMLADGTQLKRLTSQGRNTMPVWAPAPALAK